MKRVATILVAPIVIACFAVPANAASPKSLEILQHAFAMGAGGTGCTTAEIDADIGTNRVVRVEPDEGDWIGGNVDVLAVGVDGGRVTWTVGPDEAECSLNDLLDGPGNWHWDTDGEAAWVVTYRTRRHVIKATTADGIRSIGRLRAQSRSRRKQPTVRRARRAFGRPSNVVRGRGGWRVACTVAWKRLGLRATFINLAGRPPCRRGVLRSATIRGRNADQWAVRVGRRPALGTGTPLWHLEQTVGEFDESGERGWTLAEMYWPIGPESGYIPAISAIFTGRGRLTDDDQIKGFNLWVGAGGD